MIDLSGSVAILGSGREGLAAYDYLQNLGGSGSVQIITEKSSGSPREESLISAGVITVESLADANLERFDVLIRSPGISIYRDSLKAAKVAGTRITTPSSIWFEANRAAKTIVITGTKGKSSTSALLAHLLQAAGLDVELAGNIGRPLLACQGLTPDWWVIELSSYQIADLVGEPTIAVIHNIDVDHLDWHGSEGRYASDKLRLADLVSPGNLLVNADDARLVERLADRSEARWYSSSLVHDLLGEDHENDWPYTLKGRHGRENLAACLAVMRHLSIETKGVPQALATFPGLPHRLQILGKRDGIEFVNDSISSAPIATVAALEQFSDRDVVLLVGGFDRGVDWARYAGRISKNCPRAIVTMPDNGEQIRISLENAGVRPELGYCTALDLKEGVEKARDLVPAGGIVLLSPGAPSFPNFRHFEDRGHQFAQLCGFDGTRKGR